MLSEKVALIVTVFELVTISSESVSVRVSVGTVLSAIKFVENAEFKFPARSSIEFSVIVKVTIPE